MSKAFTIFGGTGDLTFRKLLPALYNGSVSGAESLDYEIVVIGRRDYTAEQYRELARDWVCLLYTSKPGLRICVDRVSRQAERPPIVGSLRWEVSLP